MVSRRWIAGLLALIVTPALSHSWYPSECCSERDCRELQPAEYRETPAGYVLWDGRVIPYGSTRPSPDGKPHLCERLIDKRVLCFFAPQGGV